MAFASTTIITQPGGDPVAILEQQVANLGRTWGVSDMETAITLLRNMRTAAGEDAQTFMQKGVGNDQKVKDFLAELQTARKNTPIYEGGKPKMLAALAALRNVLGMGGDATTNPVGPGEDAPVKVETGFAETVTIAIAILAFIFLWVRFG